MDRSLIESRAVGGPLDKLKLSAPESWDGRIQKPRAGSNSTITFHPGRYKLVDGSWLWHPEIYCDEFMHKWQYGARVGKSCLCGKRIRR